MSQKPKIKVRPHRANSGIEAAYRKRLHDIIDEMHKSVIYHVTAAYRPRETEIVGDAEPSREIYNRTRQQAKRWQSVFNDRSDIISEWLIGSVSRNVAASTKRSLSRVMPTVKFDPARVTTPAAKAAITENVSLIRTIASQYLADVENLVTRSVSQGRDLATLTTDLQARYNLTRKRATLIARDQNNKATTALTIERQSDLGIEYGRWHHSHAGKKPRASHVKANGKVFKLDKGLYLEDIGGKWSWVLPGWAINCRCTWTPLIPGIDYPIGGVPKEFKAAA